MNRPALIAAILLACITGLPVSGSPAAEHAMGGAGPAAGDLPADGAPASAAPREIPPDLLRLAHAYPGAFAAEYRDGWGVLFSDGRYIPWDDGHRHDSYMELLARPNLKDMFRHDYPALSPDTASIPAPAPDHDPGRIRHQGFFQALYGATRHEVEQRLHEIAWMPDSSPPDQGVILRVTTAFGVADRLERISAQLDALPRHYHGFLLPPAGAFYWRTIAGTQRLSAHAFGIAIDINPTFGAYWQWDSEHRYRTQLPVEIVRIFEAEGFIWGGRWYHYDTFHFEYRPELLPSVLDN